MERLQRMFAGAGGALGHPPPDSPTLDSSEQVYISSLALLKMLKHGRAGVPMEVMGLMLGEFVDEYTVRVVDVFAMPQSGTGVSVEAVDHVFQTNMLDMLKQTGRPEMVVGWYHSHPGFGCWLSGVDINTQQSFEALNQRAVAVVVDPIQSVKGKVVIDAFRLINPQTMMLGQEPRQTTSNLGHLNKPSIQALIHGLNRHYYSIAINYRKNELEEKMLLNLHKKKWTDGLTLRHFDTHSKTNEQTVQEMLNLAIKYNKAVQEEDELPPEKLAIANVGRQDAKKHLEEHVSNLMSSNIVQTLGMMLDTIFFGRAEKVKKRGFVATLWYFLKSGPNEIDVEWKLSQCKKQVTAYTGNAADLSLSFSTKKWPVQKQTIMEAMDMNNDVKPRMSFLGRYLPKSRS
ncbi:26S proteasome non-ATPase regulatory subunit 14-like protein [Mucuna pruriens]|uniref:26S proteasome non-ATPase regulatory subunit 14-like protein n=1 Tax=Mucuna pruriens TaxID=157652 RepID=A0A371FG08_MUCPR|nr:26S proteasome non-ATPase regulatory subunit 14-like protein [Mucuna pruriens]